MDIDAALIREVSKHPLIYDAAIEDYKNLKKKSHAWMQISRDVNLTTLKCKKRWKGLRDCYKRAKRSETKGSEKRKWRYYNMMSFMDRAKSCRGQVSMKANEKDEDIMSPTQFFTNIEMTGNEQNVKADDENSEISIACNSPLLSQSRTNVAQDEFIKFLKTGVESMSAVCSSHAANKAKENSTAMLFSSLALKIKEANLPKNIENRIEAKVTAVVFSEIEKYLEN